MVQVKVSSINSWDADLLKGKPYINKILFGLVRPKRLKTLGADIAGIVESVGSNVTTFKTGDEVFGDLCEAGWGGFAEYVCVNETSLAHKPKEISFEQAACIPQAGGMAIKSLKESKNIQPGDKILINGAGGGIGTFAIQLAKLYGAEVTAVDKADKFDEIIKLGADKVIDYTKENFTRQGLQYDLIIDVMATQKVKDYKKYLAKKGSYVLIGGTGSSIFNVMVLGKLVSKLNDFDIGILAHKPNHYIDELANLVKEQKVKTIIDKTFSLHQVSEAFNYFYENTFKGKIVITI